MEEWTLNEEQINKIIETKPRKIPESTVFNDLSLPKEERIKHASMILRIWKSEVKDMEKYEHLNAVGKATEILYFGLHPDEKEE